MRHVVRVMRPTRNTGTLGETQGKPDVLLSQWPCSINLLTSNETDAARQLSVNVQYEVKGIGPIKGLDETCYLEFGPEGSPTRTMGIGFIDDKQLNGINLRLLCGETR